MELPELTLELLGGLRIRWDEQILCEFPPRQTGVSSIISTHRVTHRAALFLAALALVLLPGLVWKLRMPHRLAGPSSANAATTSDRSLPGVYGAELWSRSLAERPGDGGSEPTAMTTDELGNLYLTGLVHTAEHDVDYVTLKLDANGTQLWQSRYNNTHTNDCDRARSLAVDDSHNVYVTGDSYNGDWDKGGTDYDVVTIKYDANGKPSATWPDAGDGVGVRRYDGVHRADWGKKVAVDRAGNVYVGVTSVRATARRTPCSDFVILKYDPHGNRQWCYRYNNTGGGEDTLNDLAVDVAGNVTVTGSGKESGHSRMVTLQVSAAGKRRWVQTYDGPGNVAVAASPHSLDHRCNDVGSHLMLDHLSNVYVAGYAKYPNQAGDGERMVIVNYTANGALKWSQADPLKWDFSKPCAIAVDAGSNVVVVSEARLGRPRCVRLLAYDAYGTLRWSKYETGHAPFGDPGPFNMANDMVLDSKGSIYIIGSLYDNAGGRHDYGTLRYDLNGVANGIFLYDGPVHKLDIGMAIAVDGQGNFYATGQAEGKSHRSITTVKYCQ